MRTNAQVVSPVGIEPTTRGLKAPKRRSSEHYLSAPTAPLPADMPLVAGGHLRAEATLLWAPCGRGAGAAVRDSHSHRRGARSVTARLVGRTGGSRPLKPSQGHTRLTDSLPRLPDQVVRPTDDRPDVDAVRPTIDAAI
jgi:hypothetical protein